MADGKRGRKAGQGRFEGGRKALPPDDENRRVNVTVKLPLWLREWLKTQKTAQSRLIETALIDTYQIEKPTNERRDGEQCFAADSKPPA